MKKIIACLLLGALSQSVWALDAADQQRLNSIQQSWAHIQYELPEGQRTAAFEKLAAQASSFKQERQTVAEAWIWSGIVTSSWAGARGDWVRWARSRMPRPTRKSPGPGPQGPARLSLYQPGALYDRVPGWPIGFGDADKAEQLLKLALQMNPNGIDSLYFWGDHLYRQKRYVEARAALQKALLAAPRPGREALMPGAARRSKRCWWT